MKRGLLGFGADVVRAKALSAKVVQAEGYEENVVGAKTLKGKSGSSQRVRGKRYSGQKVRAFLQKVTYPLAPATMRVFKGYEENDVQATGYVHFAKSHVPLIGTFCCDQVGCQVSL